MAKQIARIVLTGGPAGGKTSLVNRIQKEFKTNEEWRIITIPETATELISGFGIGPFPGCMPMLNFQYYVIPDQLHKEALALKAAYEVPQEKVLILYDRAVPDDKAYISDEDFAMILQEFGHTEQEILDGYDGVIFMTTCAKGAEFAYSLNNKARTESISAAREMDDNSRHAWANYPGMHIVENYGDLNEKLDYAISVIHSILQAKGME